jgi:hypothetical protein
MGSIYKMCGPGSSVGITTYYGLDGPGIENLRLLAPETLEGITKITTASQDWELHQCIAIL